MYTKAPTPPRTTTAESMIIGTVSVQYARRLCSPFELVVPAIWSDTSLVLIGLFPSSVTVEGSFFSSLLSSL